MNARLAASELLSLVLDEGRALDDALKLAPAYVALEGRDRAFGRAIASATLRRLGGIDAVLAEFIAKPLPDTATMARALLRTGAAQLLYMGTPAHAAVSETVIAANSAPSARGFAKLINAVLRKVSGPGREMVKTFAPGIDLPSWLMTRWRAAYGGFTADSIAASLLTEPPLDVTVKDDPLGWANQLGGALLPTGSIRLPMEHPAVEALPGYEDGGWWVQDAAAALPALLLGDVRGKTVLDLCAAPGGKTLQLAAAGAQVTAVDRDRDRLDVLKENLTRTRLEAKTVCADALKLRAATPFDCGLLDAPCSATGTLRRHPDVAWLRRPTDIPKLAELQRQLLDAAAGFIAPGGMLVYAVCSLEPEEGPAVVEAALSKGDWSRAPLKPAEMGGLKDLITPDGDLRTLPSRMADLGGMDGFYAARLVRR